MFSIKRVADLAGVTQKTLRHYDKIGLLKPSKRGENGYRYYSTDDLDRLQQIMIYRELDFQLVQIARILDAEDFEIQQSLAGQIDLLKAKSKRLQAIIQLAQDTLKNIQGENKMTQDQKFQAFKTGLIEDNDRQYGEEVVQRYGAEAYQASQKKLKSMTAEQYAVQEQLTQQVNQAFIEAKKQGDPTSPSAREAVELHKRWLMFYWTDFCVQAHIGVANMYVDDPRFSAYYDKLGDGMAKFVRDCIVAYYI